MDSDHSWLKLDEDMNKILWALFGNDDDPIPPAAYYSNKPQWFRKMMWWLRNPCHNLFHYVLGIRGKPFTVLWYLKEDATLVEGFNIVIKKYYLLFPLISYQKTFKTYIFQFYLGWRRSGALGGKLRFRHKDIW